MSNIVKYEEQKKDITVFKEMATIALRSGKYPKEYDESTILNIFLTAKDLGISPMKALNGGFYIVSGKISMSTTLMVDRIRSAGHSIKITEWTRDKCVMIGKRRDNDDSVKVEFTMEDAQLAGLLGSPTWKRYPKSMLYNRAMSMLARVLFPDVVGNAYSEDEKYDIQNIPPEKRPMMDVSDEIIINHSTGEVNHNDLIEMQSAQIDMLLQEDPDAVEKIKARFGVERIHDIDPSYLQPTIDWLLTRKGGEKNANVA